MTSWSIASIAGFICATSGDSFAMSPPLIVERSHIDEMVSILGDAIKAWPDHAHARHRILCGMNDAAAEA